MPDFVMPFINLLICFLSLAICIRYLFSKKGWLWIAPLLLTLLLSFISALNLIGKVSSITINTSLFITENSTLTLIFLILWLLVLLGFRYTIKNFGSKAYSSSINKKESNYLDKKHRRDPDFKEY